MTPQRPRFVSYLRVSTDGQGRSGLGLEAQRQAVAAHVAQAGGEVVAEFREVESGKRADRPQLAAALASCRTRRAVLVIAKLDRLARNARFLLSVVEGSGEAGVVFCDLPTVPAGPVGKFLVTQMAAVAELEAGLISQRTRAALAVAKVRGVKLGNPSPTRAVRLIRTVYCHKELSDAGSASYGVADTKSERPWQMLQNLSQKSATSAQDFCEF